MILYDPFKLSPSRYGLSPSNGSLQPIHSQVPSLQTTCLIETDMPMIDLVLHIGDISYAGVVSQYESDFHSLSSVMNSLILFNQYQLEHHIWYVSVITKGLSQVRVSK